jgi:hypothetical protein
MTKAYVAAVGDVAPAASLVRAQIVRARQALCFLRHEDVMIGAVPVGERVLTADVPGQRVGLARAEHGLQDRPGPFPRCHIPVRVAVLRDGGAFLPTGAGAQSGRVRCRGRGGLPRAANVWLGSPLV